MTLPAPSGVTARYYGPYNSANVSQYWYWVQALYPEGYSALSIAGVTSAHCPASLSGSGFNAVQWNPAPGAIGYLVWRTTTSTPPGTGGTLIFIATSETGIKDDGTLMATVSTPRFDGNYTWKAVYNFAVDGGAIGAITPAISDTIPAGAIIFGAIINSPTAVLSAGAATISIGTTAGSSAASILAATGKASFSIDAIQYFLAGTGPYGVAAFKMTAAGQIDLTVAAATLTAGIIEITLFGILASNP